MNQREKLVELIKNAKVAMKSENLSCDLARNGFVADFLIANGVIVLPCKVGDFLWFFKNDELVFGEVQNIIIDDYNKIYADVDILNDLDEYVTTWTVYLSDLGKSVFFTKEEAERALDERNRKYG